MDARLLGEHAICSDCPQQVHDEIFKAPMSWMLYLSNVLQLVIHRFYYSTLTEQKLVGYAHQGSFQKPKNQPMEHLPLCAMPLNTLWTCILWFRHTLRGVLSAKLMPVHLPSSTFLMNSARGMATSFSSSTNRLYETTSGKRWRIYLQTFSR